MTVYIFNEKKKNLYPRFFQLFRLPSTLPQVDIQNFLECNPLNRIYPCQMNTKKKRSALNTIQDYRQQKFKNFCLSLSWFNSCKTRKWEPCSQTRKPCKLWCKSSKACNACSKRHQAAFSRASASADFQRQQLQHQRPHPIQSIPCWINSPHSTFRRCWTWWETKQL